jgi:hypothetical protein
VGAAGVGVSTASQAQASLSCPLPLDQQLDSIKAFEPIAKFVTREPRCFNCHGGVNPHIEGVGSDPEDPQTPVSTVEHGGGRIPHDSRGTGTVAGGCLECHSNMAHKRDGSKSNWMTAPPVLTFVGKDAPTLCKQFKRATGSAEHFLGHLKDDNGGNNFSGTAFKGGCGLDPVMFRKDLEEEGICKPPSIPHGEFERLGAAWIEAMGGEFEGDESCGCVPQVNLTIEHHLADRLDTIKYRGGFAVFSSDLRFEAQLDSQSRVPAEVFAPKQSTKSSSAVRLAAQVYVNRAYQVRHIKNICPGDSVEGTHVWFIEAMLDPDTQMLDLSFETGSLSTLEGIWACLGPDGGGVDIFSEVNSHGPYRMPAASGSRQRFVIPQLDGIDEFLTVTVK